ncbi:MAG: 16S rRNA (cytidine(1402)-2'-O)-methyltransferase [Lachnospiraceae bacterium]|nr:16S rRNA (cytidine(1402)-2'-O)-methyltransferase [Lachnospiraceae bacterium]
MSGTLYLCATPIGNLKDITLRVLETLEAVDLIAAEDTRNSKKLLNHYEIHTPLTAYHEHNKQTKAKKLIALLKEGKDIALVTDAGTPAISDPGQDLVALCMEEGVAVTSLPGPTACITALTLSGFHARRFVFEGFLPGKEDKKERAKALGRLENETRTIILYAAPHDLERDLTDLYETLGARRIALCRELTKKFEEVVITTLSESRPHPRGEYVLVIEGKDEKDLVAAQQAQWEEISIPDHVAQYEAQGLDRKEAMKKAALDRGITKRDVYRALLENRSDV